MATMNISIPADMRDWIQEVVSAGGYQTASEYFRELVRRDQKERAKVDLEQLLLDGLESGKGVEISPEFWEDKRKELLSRFARRKKKA